MSLYTIVDKADMIIGYKKRDEMSKDDIYRVSGLMVYNSNKEFLLAQRAFTKSHNPGEWGPSVAGTVEKGETYEENIIKEAQEEIGISINPQDLIIGFKTYHDGEHLFFAQMFYVKLDRNIAEFSIEKEEVEAIQWFSFEQFEYDLHHKVKKFTPRTPFYIQEFIKKFTV